MGRHMSLKIKVNSDTLQDPIYRLPINRLVLVTSSIALTSEEVVTEVYIRSILQVQCNRFHDGGINRDVPILFYLSGITGLLLDDREGISEGAVRINQIGES